MTGENSRNMTRQEVIRRLCVLQEEVSRHLADYDNAADCFCKKGGFWIGAYYSDAEYRNDGVSLEWIEHAVRDKIKAAEVSP